MLYRENDFSLCFNVSALVGWLGNKYIKTFRLGKKKGKNVSLQSPTQDRIATK